jgi:hypothetical protein
VSDPEYVPFTSREPVSYGDYPAKLMRFNTVPAWLIASCPLWIVVLPVVVDALGMPLTWSGIFSWAAIFFVATMLCAALDQRLLSRWGAERATSPYWVFATPLVYLMIRGRRGFVHNFTSGHPTWLHVLCIGFVCFSLQLTALYGTAVSRLFQVIGGH